MGTGAVSPGLVATARALAVDRQTADIVRLFGDAGIPAILLKGATHAEWLYSDGTPRPYGDTDLLVPPDRLERAEALLRRTGFRPIPPRRPLPGTPHAEGWERERDHVQVDLHRNLYATAASPEETWAVLDAEAVPFAVGGSTVRALPLHGRALMVSLHAQQHGDEIDKVLEDLRRAVQIGDRETWEMAARLADRLDAVPVFTKGLRRVPAGRTLAEDLGLPSPGLTDATDGATGVLALGLDRLKHTKGLRARLRLVRREVFPSPDRMRWWSPFARRGRVGLALAYVWRPTWLMIHAVPALLRHRRVSKRGSA